MGNHDLKRAHRVFWSLLFVTSVAMTWLWDQTTGAALYSGRFVIVIDALAALVVAVGVFLMMRIIWQPSGRHTRGDRR